MPKSFKFVCIALTSALIAILSASIDANKGGIPGGPGKGIMNPGKGHQSKKFDGHGSKKPLIVSPTSKAKFSNKDREIITNFFSTHPFNTTGLPPGIAKNLARGKPLPPGIAKVFLPKDLSSSLVTYPGYYYLVAGKDVLLVNKSNQIIADILYNVLR